jgi:hypothetical protein
MALLAALALANLDGVSLDLSGLRGDIVEAYELGRSHGREHLDLPTRSVVSGDPFPRVTRSLAEAELEAEDAILAIEERTLAQLERSRRLFEDAEDLDAVLLGIEAARLAELRAEQGLVSLVHERINAGTADVVTEAGGKLVWLAERDACLHCLAYSGRVRDGDSFPWGLTFSDPPRPLKAWKRNLTSPPLHPWCRCQLIGWNGVDSGGAGLNFPDSLRREARRSVIKGWALPSESQTARQRAAARLLAIGAGLPPTVEARARAAVRSKRFRTRPAP